MAIIKCKMCGGDLEVVAESRVAVCEYCGTQQTVPSVDNEKKLTLFGRANRLRMACEFDKAAGVYEGIVADFPEEAEAYWGLVLCKYGIEYVDDPATGKKIPTCHRSSFDSVMDDSNLDQALENADAIARRVYRDEAKAIEDLRKGIIEVSGKEDPYDIFICYKETDDSGDRTIDSVIAQEVYDALTENGYRVFFSRITLEDKLGQEYEPYIFAALHSAKIMLAFGTDYEYYNAVWVKNEWSRFLQLIAAGEKKTLIPCYKNIDAYDMPKEFARLQAQDMGKVGAMQDLLRGIEKILPREKQVVKETIVVQQSAETTKVQAMLERAFLFLEDGDWNAANEYCEKALDIDPKCAEAYLGKLMVDMHVRNKDGLKDCAKPFDGNSNYQKIIRFGNEVLKEDLERYIACIGERNQEAAYKTATTRMNEANTESEYRQAVALFEDLGEYKDAKQLSGICCEEAEKAAKNAAEAAEKEAEQKRKKYAKTVAVGFWHTIGLRDDGTVTVIGDNSFGQDNVSNWHDIVSVAAGDWHTVGLRSDGKVLVTEIINNDLLWEQSDVSSWKNIVAIFARGDCTVGLCANGTVLTAGGDYNGNSYVLPKLHDIVEIAVGGHHTICLYPNGSVTTFGHECHVSDWCNIVSVAAGESYVVGLRADGTVVATGDNRFGQCDVSGWHDIVEIAAYDKHTVGLCSDGTVVATGYNDKGQCNVDHWYNIVAIAVSSNNTVGLCADGSVMTTGDNQCGQCDVSDLKLMVGESRVSQEALAKAHQKRQQEKATKLKESLSGVKMTRDELASEQTKLQAELPTLKGLFSGGRRKEVEARLAEIPTRIAEIDSELARIEKELAESG